MVSSCVRGRSTAFISYESINIETSGLKADYYSVMFVYHEYDEGSAAFRYMSSVVRDHSSNGVKPKFPIDLFGDRKARENC